MKSIVAETKITWTGGGEYWRQNYDNSLKLLGACCVETLTEIEIQKGPEFPPYDSFRAIHEFLFPAGCLQLEYVYEDFGEKDGAQVIFCVHDISKEPDVYPNEAVAAAMTKIQESVTEATFMS